MKKTLTVFFIFSFLVKGDYSYGQAWREYHDSVKHFISQRKPDQAAAYYKKVKALIPADSLYTDTYIQLSKSMALLYYSGRQYDESILVCNEARKIIEEAGSEINGDYAFLCNLLGAIYNINGKLDTALAIHRKAKEIRQKLFGDKDPSYAQSCNNLGALYRDLGQYDMAEPLLLEAKDIREKLPPAKQNDGFAITCVSLANLYRDMGQFEKAESFYLYAKERRALPGKDNRDYALSCNILADLYSYMGNYDNAEALYLEAKDIRAKLDSGGYEYGQSCNNLAGLYREMGQYQKAEALALEAKEIYERELDEDDPSRTIQLNNLGELYYAMGKYNESAAYFLKARQLWEKELGKEHPYFMANSEELARVYRNMNETEKAGKLFEEVSRLKYEQLGKIFRFTNESEKQQYLRNINGSGDEYQSFYFKKIPHNKAGHPFTMSLLNRNLILSSTQQARQVIYNSRDTVLVKKYNEWTGIKQQLANLYSQGSGAKFEQVKTLEEKANSIEKDLSRRSSAFKNLQKEISWRDIQQRLAPGEAAIEFIEFRLHNDRRETDSIMYAALILRKNSTQPVLVPLFEKAELDSLYRDDLPDETAAIDRYYSSPAFFNLIWKPMEKQLAGVSKVYYAPAGRLFRIPFAALPVSGTHVLSDKYRLVQLTTTAAITDQSDNFITRGDKVQVYGGIVYDADSLSLKEAVSAYGNKTRTLRSVPGDLTRGKTFRYLPGTQEEAETIKKQAGKAGITVSVLSGIHASEESFMSLTGAASPSVLHIATHGFFFPDPQNDTRDTMLRKFETSGKAFRESANPLMRAGLLFAGANNTWRGKPMTGIEDGIVTAYEAATMYLPGTKLVVLSACETALGDIDGGEGVYGLQRAFRMAGVKNLVMSLWKVPDAETSAFMQAFYRNMFHKQSVTDAFYDAQKSMKNLYRNEPHKWAAWVLIR